MVYAAELVSYQVSIQKNRLISQKQCSGSAINWPPGSGPGSESCSGYGFSLFYTKNPLFKFLLLFFIKKQNVRIFTTYSTWPQRCRELDSSLIFKEIVPPILPSK
jgi:hypothetical protein